MDHRPAGVITQPQLDTARCITLLTKINPLKLEHVLLQYGYEQMAVAFPSSFCCVTTMKSHMNVSQDVVIQE